MVVDEELDAYNEEAVTPMKAAPKVLSMVVSTMLEGERATRTEKKEKNNRSEAVRERRKRDRLKRSPALARPSFSSAGVSGREVKEGEGSMWLVIYARESFFPGGRHRCNVAFEFVSHPKNRSCLHSERRSVDR